MKNEFLIISKNIKLERLPGDLDLVYECNLFSFYSNLNLKEKNSSLVVLIDGYVLPRNGNTYYHDHKDPIKIADDFHDKYGNNFTCQIKGIFTIVIIKEKNINLFTDHLGLKKAFYYISGGSFCISNNYQLITAGCGLNKLNGNALAIKSLLNREVLGETLIKGIQYTLPATHIQITEENTIVSQYWDETSLINDNKLTSDMKPFEEFFLQNIKNIHGFFEPKKTAITLTGGKDSRTALTALLNWGIKPLGITYGNPLTIDAVYARKLAEKADIEHIVVNPEKSLNWFENEIQEIVNLNNPLINIHRAHRHFSMKTLQKRVGENTCFYSGYMGGELLMGVYFDNLIFTNLIKDFWKNGLSELESVPTRLRNNFLKINAFDIEQVKVQLLELKSFDAGKIPKNMQFHSMFEIGVLHHSQDVEIASNYFDYPIPFFLDIEFLELLFHSKYNFREQNVDTKNLLKRHSLFWFNLSLQHKFFPKLDSVYYAKKGTYNTKEFLRGSMYWSLVKTVRYFLRSKKYPPTFSYNEDYRLYLMNKLKEIIADNNSPINEIYDVPKALNSLLSDPLLTTESPLHRYSNIVMHYLQYKRYTSQ